MDDKYSILIKICYKESAKEEGGLSNKRNYNILAHPNQLIGSAIQELIKENEEDLVLNNKYFYLKRDGKIISKVKITNKVSFYDMKEDDEILISDKKEKIPKPKQDDTVKVESPQKISSPIKRSTYTSEQVINNSNSVNNFEDIELCDFNNINFNQEDEKEEENLEEKKDEKLSSISEENPIVTKKCPLRLIIILTIILLLIIAIVIIIVVLVTKKKSGDEDDLNKLPEELMVVNIEYQTGEIMKFHSEKSTSVILNSELIEDKYKNNTIKNYIDYFLVIENEEYEYNKTSKTKYVLYNGYLCILNNTIDDGDSTVSESGDNNINNIINGVENEGNSENGYNYFVKVNFYKNGVIKNIFYPEGFNLSNIGLIEEILNEIIPKISKNLYTDNSTDIYNNLLNISFDDLYQEKENLRLLLEQTKENNNENEDSKITQKLEKTEYNFEINLRDTQKETIKDENNEDYSYTLLKNYKSNIPESDGGVTFNGGIIKTTTTVKINDLTGKVENIINEKHISLNNSDSIIGSEINNPEEIYIDNEISSEENLINEISSLSNFSNIDIYLLNSIENKEVIKNENIFNKLNNYLKNFEYKLYNKSETSLKNYALRKLNADDSKINIETINNTNYTFTSSDYYGQKNIKFTKNLYDYDVFGMNLKATFNIEISLSTGKIKNNFNLFFGSIKIEANFENIKTNLHIIIKNINEMTYKLTKLIEETDKKLLIINKEYSNNILDIEKNAADIYSDNLNINDFFTTKLNNMFNDVKSFAKTYFTQLNKRIDETSEEFNTKIKKINENTYDLISTIRSKLVTEYNNYIETYSKKFISSTLLIRYYIGEIKNQVTNLSYFKIDVLYDLIDLFYESAKKGKEFLPKLQKNVNNGIKILIDNLRTFFNETMYNFFNTTDYLEFNFDRNEIISELLNDNEKSEKIQKIKNFKYSIFYIFEIILNKFKKELDEETKENSGYYKRYKERINDSYLLLNNDIKSSIQTIKGKITNITELEFYTDHIEMVKEISNNSIISFLSDFYNVISKSLSIKPDYLDSESEFMIKINELFNISKKIVNTINQEMENINSNLEKKVEEFKENNLFKLQQNLYNFKNDCIEDIKKNLYNNLTSNISTVIKQEYLQKFKIVSENFELYIENLQQYIQFLENKNENDTSQKLIQINIVLCSNFYYKAENYISIMEKLLNSLNTTVIQNSIKKYFYEIRDNFTSYFEESIENITQFGYESEFYAKYFYSMEQIKVEYYKLKQQVYNYFNESVLTKILKDTEFIINNEIKNYTNSMIFKIRGLISQLSSKYKTKECNSDIYYSYNIPISGTNNSKSFEFNIENIETYYENLKSDTPIFNIMNEIFENLKSYIGKYTNIWTETLDYSLIEKSLRFSINNKTLLQTLLNEYVDKFNEIINDYSNVNLLKKLFFKDYGYSIEEILNTFEENVNKVNSSYYETIYKQYYRKLFEYPVELIHLIKDIENEISENAKEIKKITNSAYKNRILNTIKKTNYYIRYINNYNYKYILFNIDFNNIVEDYKTSRLELFESKFEDINENFEELSQKFDNDYEILINLNLKNEDDFILNSTYDNKISSIINNYNEFSQNIEKNSQNDFTKMACDQQKAKDPSIEECTKTYNDYNFNDYRYDTYNFHTSKLRKSLNFSNKIVVNIKDLFTDLNVSDYLDINIIEKEDEIANDKNIMLIYNISLNKIKNINDEVYNNLQNSYLSIYDKIQIKNIFKENYSSFFDLLVKKLLNYEVNITETKNNILLYWQKFNKILNLKLNLIKEYTFYNYNETFISEKYNYYLQLIEKYFQKHQDEIAELQKGAKFFYQIKKIIFDLNNEKISKCKEIINTQLTNNNCYSSKNFNYINLTIFVENQLQSEIYTHEQEFFSEFFDNYKKNIQDNLNTFMKKKLNNLNEMKTNIITSLEEYFSSFINDLQSDRTDYITKEYIAELSENNTFCKQYTDEKIKTMDQEELNSTEVQKNILFCKENNYFSQKVTIFDEFTENENINLKKNLDNILNEIEISELNENNLFEYLKNNTQLTNNISLENLYEDIQNICSDTKIINSIKQEEYKDLLNETILNNFNESYNNFVDEFIVNDIINNFDIGVNYKISILDNYMTNKLIDETTFYIQLINKTARISNSTKLLYSTLYENIKNDILEIFKNETDDLNLEVDFFYNRYKNIFRDNYINYFKNNINKNTEIPKISELMDEIILDPIFNNTLNQISDTIINNKIIKKIKNNIQEKIEQLNTNFSLTANDLQKNIIEEMDKHVTYPAIPIPAISSNMNTINEENKNLEIKESFTVSNAIESTINETLTEDFYNSLNEITSKYIDMESQIYEKAYSDFNNFDRYYTELEKEMGLNTKNTKLNSYMTNLNNSLNNYYDDLINNLDNLYDKLSVYTYINGSFYANDNNNESIFGSDNGELFLDDINYQLMLINNSLYDFCNIITVNDYLNLNNINESFYSNFEKYNQTLVNMTNRYKSIFSSENYEKIKAKLYELYGDKVYGYIFDDYIPNISTETDDFLSYISISKNVFGKVSNLSLNYILGIYNTINYLIKLQFTQINEDQENEIQNIINLKTKNNENSINFNDEDLKKIALEKIFFNVENSLISAKNNLQDKKNEIKSQIFDTENDNESYIENLTYLSQGSFVWEDVGKIPAIKLCNNYDSNTISNYSTSLNELQNFLINIIPNFNITCCTEIGYEKDQSKSLALFYINSNLNAISKISMETGIYFPSFKEGIESSIIYEIEGTLGEGDSSIVYQQFIKNEENYRKITKYKSEKKSNELNLNFGLRNKGNEEKDNKFKYFYQNIYKFNSEEYEFNSTNLNKKQIY